MSQKQKHHEQTQEATKSETEQGISVADDKTALDELEEKKRKVGKKKLPKGYKKRLEEGTYREIRVVGKRLGRKGEKVFKVTDLATQEVVDYDKLKIEGESELVHEVDDEGHGTAHILTKSPILVGRGIVQKGRQIRDSLPSRGTGAS